MRTPQWQKILGGHAGVLFVTAELSKRGIPCVPLATGFPAYDILLGTHAGDKLGWVQVKSMHPERSRTFILREDDERWVGSPAGQFVVFVSLGDPKTNEAPRYWIATQDEVGTLCVNHHAHGTTNWERRFGIEPEPSPKNNRLPAAWENRWTLFDPYCVAAAAAMVKKAAKKRRRAS